MLVSVIIPCFNVVQYIEECVISVINQTYHEIEIICIDNNSTDNTWKKLEELKGKYPQILIDKEFKAGAPAARNKGLQISKGEWIQFLDADDLLMSDKIEHQVELANKSKCAFIAGAYKKRSVKGIEIDSILLNENKYLAPYLNQCGITSSNLWQKDELNKIFGWNNNLKSSQETDLMFRLVLNECNFLIDSCPLTIVRDRESGQISQRNPKDKWMQFINLRLQYIEQLKKSNIDEYKINYKVFFDFLMVSIITLARYDMDTAIYIYNSSIKKQWKTSGQYGFSFLKVSLIRFLGLKLFLKLFLK